jgi:hypothetical protein
VILMAVLTSKKRSKLPTSAFVYPGSKKYPIHDLAHARNALSRAAQKGTSGDYATVKAAVCRRYPNMPACKATVKKKGRKRR